MESKQRKAVGHLPRPLFTLILLVTGLNAAHTSRVTHAQHEQRLVYSAVKNRNRILPACLEHFTALKPCHTGHLSGGYMYWHLRNLPVLVATLSSSFLPGVAGSARAIPTTEAAGLQLVGALERLAQADQTGFGMFTKWWGIPNWSATAFPNASIPRVSVAW